jgi:prolyl oligopeptidase
MSRQKRFTYPYARQADVVDDYHGTRVADPYRWLEEPNREETQAWMAAQHELTRGILDAMPGRTAIASRLTFLLDYAWMGTPERRGERLFFERNDGLQNQAVLYWQLSPANEPKVLLDPNLLSAEGTVAVTTHSLSMDGTLLAYNLSRDGSDWQDIHVRHVDRGTDYGDVLHWVKFAPAAWKADNSGFFYARYPAPGEMPDAPPSTHQRIYWHRLGTPQDQDELVYARPDAPTLGFTPRVTLDDRYLVLHVWDGTDRRNRFYYREVESQGDVIRLLDEIEARAGHGMGKPTSKIIAEQTDVCTFLFDMLNED